MIAYRHAAVLTVMVLLCAGCASITARQDESQNEVHLYAGVHDDVYYLFHPGEADYPSLQWLNVVDLPFSTVADTVMIPVDLTGDPYWWVPELQPGSYGSWTVK
jgi:uncharacterized protein YceK